MERVILHSDINSCYVSVELLERPELRGQPVAVGGDVEARHGIILAKSEEAKRCGVKTGMVLWQARQLCPELTVLRPHYEKYEAVSRAARAIYADFTDRQEPFGLDESWLDITGCHAWKDGYLAAQEVRRRMRRELGLTVSVGVSWNKAFAKLGSDYKKPDAVTEFRRDNFKELVWPLPVGALLFAGPASCRALGAMGIRTVGQLALADPEALRLRLGKGGLTLYRYANGWDESPVRRFDCPPEVKSIGNSTTPPRDLRCEADVRRVMLALAEEVAGRLRAERMLAGQVEVSVRDAVSLRWTGHQAVLDRPTDITRELFQRAMALFDQLHAWPAALRGLGLRTAALRPSGGPEQMDLFTDYAVRDSQRRIDAAVDAIRAKYGKKAIRYLGAAKSEELPHEKCSFAER